MNAQFTSTETSISIDEGVPKQFWCFLCKKEFLRVQIKDSEVHCRFCGKSFCEEVSTGQHPSLYEPYENQIRRTEERRVNRGSSVLDIFSSLLNFNEDAHMENIINYLMANDPNKYGSPPTSKEEISKLTRTVVTLENKDEINKCSAEGCSVCKDEYEINQWVISLPCSHRFHDECILPWLKERNSCPTCRFELKTDDHDYEQRKNQKREEVRSTLNTN